MYNEGCTFAVMEVSSHSLVLNRVYGLSFSSAIFTNITSDHLDFHLSFENYFNAKKILFDSLSSSSFSIYNSDDEHSRKIIKDTKANLFSYGTSSNSDFKLKDIKYNLAGTTFTVEYKDKNYPVSTSLIGRFNAYNACAAFAVGSVYGFKDEIIIEGIKKTKQVPGRFEVIGKENKKVIQKIFHTHHLNNKSSNLPLASRTESAGVATPESTLSIIILKISLEAIGFGSSQLRANKALW